MPQYSEDPGLRSFFIRIDRCVIFPHAHGRVTRKNQRFDICRFLGQHFLGNFLCLPKESRLDAACYKVEVAQPPD